MRLKVILLLPLAFNDGSIVPKATVEAIYDALFALCDGYTIAGEVQGAYRMQTGEKQVDACVEVWVAVEPELIDELRRLVASFGLLLGQDTMYFERTGAAVEFLSPAPPPAGDIRHE